jgi:hypothetical protein
MEERLMMLAPDIDEDEFEDEDSDWVNDIGQL